VIKYVQDHCCITYVEEENLSIRYRNLDGRRIRAGVCENRQHFENLGEGLWPIGSILMMDAIWTVKAHRE
jgi:hypothetical protein